MKKARVAPMLHVQPQIQEKVKEYKDSADKRFVDIKEKCHKKWNLLKNTIRFNIKLKKQFEEINCALMQDRFNSTTHDPIHVMQCLLQDDEKEAGNVKRKNYKRSSERNKDISRRLIHYFVELAKIEDPDEKIVDFVRLESMFESGVDINVTDKHGQSVLHEVARTWHVDVAQFLLDHGAVVNHPDDYGRTPLHVACAVDYPEMVEFLLLRGADLNSRTYGEEQSAIHYAAKNDSSDALTILLKYDADMNDKDYKQRTPLQIAAELDRSTTAQILIEEGAPAGVYDESMMAAIVLMIEKMPNVANQALDQFYLTNRASRRQFFYLNFLTPPTEAKTCYAKSPLEVLVECKQFQLVLHPVFLRLIEVKWQRLGKWGVWLYGTANLLLCLIWTIRLCTIPTDKKQLYQGNNGILGAFFEAIALLSFVMCLGSELREFLKAKRKNDGYIQWREKELERDLKYAHPRWPEERLYLERETRAVQDKTSSYIRDYWNYFDLVTYVLMFIVIMAQVINIQMKTKMSDHIMRAIGSITLIFLWVRMLKYSRPFKKLGPFVVMLSHVASDLMMICHLLLHFFIPYVAAFWIIFGIDDVEGFTLKGGEIFYNIFQMTVVGDYSFENLEKHSAIMARILCFSYIFLGGVICLNLFIALMSDTFQRVYDNAKANAIMERAATIINLEADFSTSILQRHREWVDKHCSPESLYYDDDVTDEKQDLKRMTHQVKSKLDEVHDYLEEQFGKVHGGTENQQQHHVTNVSKVKGQQRDSTTASDVRELVKTMHSLRAEYRKSIMQTRAEIAGLGLMFKELMEQNNSRRERKQKKRKHRWISELSKSMSKKRDNNLLNNELLNNEDKQDTDARSDTTGSMSLNMSTSTGSGYDHGKQNNGEELENREHELEERNSTPTQHPNEEYIEMKSSNLELNLSEQNDGYFEGYMFNEQPQQTTSDDHLIKSTWNSIFSKILNTQKQSDDSDDSDKNTEAVYYKHSNLSTIESSEDDTNA